VSQVRLVTGLVAFATLLMVVGCGSHAVSTASSGPPSRGDLPPVWVQQEVLWQSLAAGDAYPQWCRWLLIRPSRAAAVGGKNTDYLRMFTSFSEGLAYVVVLCGHFHTDSGGTARTLYLVLAQRSHLYLAHGPGVSLTAFAKLGRRHSFVPRLPFTAGLWGHAMFEGGPFPGGPRPLAHVAVAIWKGSLAGGQTLTTVRADANGFFSLNLPPGTYTLKLTSADSGWPTPTTVTVEPGKPAAAGVYGEAP
jgi:hypothetical protein